ncbi:DUF72 domain-containing protein [Hymenobacter elongatus]|uniref:DUF72 domain-containing protein n=1 Tax=Hymenobacter elongatus TaxID=877208 RepID=A0A4Z0PFM5_9BACT|nr:DUF72 domain-containing protein [Hymenobacter elongatus]
MPELYTSAYSPEFLQRIATEVAAIPTLMQAYLYFNNGIGGVGVADAKVMQRLLPPGQAASAVFQAAP